MKSNVIETGTKDITSLEMTLESTQIPDLPQTETVNIKPIITIPDFELELTELELKPTGTTSLYEEDVPISYDLEYLRLKRVITEECVKLQIFTPAGIKKLCERKTRTRTDLDPERVGNMIGQILRELEID